MRHTRTAAAAGWAMILFLSVQGMAAEGFNVLLVTVDTLRYDRISALSSRFVKTPNLDALAGKSLVFANAYAHSTLTRPSHANIMTGTTPLNHGVSDNPGFRLEKRYPTMAESFKGAVLRPGRLSAPSSSIPSSAWTGVSISTTTCTDSRPSLSGGPTRWSLRLSIGSPDRTEKWFGWIHLFDPHDPYDPPEPFKSLYAKIRIPAKSPSSTPSSAF